MNLLKRGIIIFVSCGIVLLNMGCNHSNAPIKPENNKSQQDQKSIPEKNLRKITITELPTKRQYFIGEDIDLTGIKLQAHYSDGSIAAILLENMTVESVNMFQLGKQNVVLKNGDLSVAFEIDVLYQQNNLPVVYIETKEHALIDSKDTYVDADIKIYWGG